MITGYDVFCPGPSPEFSSRGAKNQRGGTFLKYSIGCMQQPVGQIYLKQGRIKGGSNGGNLPSPRCKAPSGDEIYLFKIKYSFESFL